MRGHFHNGLAALGLAVGLAIGPAAKADDTIRIAENDWTGQLIDINLAKIVMTEHMGLDVELVFADYTGQWAALATGDLDVAMEIWPAFSFDAHREWVVEKGKVEVIGDLGVIGATGWYVPTYMIEGDPERGIEPMTPDLRTWEDINRYIDVFKRPETGDKGFCIDAVPSWEIHNEERLASLGVDLVNVYAGTEGALIAEIESAYKKGEPLFICDFWTPHWLFAVYDLTEIELPPYSDECWGIGGLEPGDFACGFPEGADVQRRPGGILRGASASLGLPEEHVADHGTAAGNAVLGGRGRHVGGGRRAPVDGGERRRLARLDSGRLTRSVRAGTGLRRPAPARFRAVDSPTTPRSRVGRPLRPANGNGRSETTRIAR